MKQWIAAAMMIGGFWAATTFAAPKPEADPVQKALKDKYPDAKVQVIRTHEVNGVKVTDAKITTKDGDSTAQVTEYGDFVLYGLPRKGGMSGIAKPAGDTVTGLFKGSPSDVDIYWMTNYLVDLGVGKKVFRLRFDPVGHLRDIDSSSEMKETEVSTMTKASKSEADKAESYAKKYFPDAKINNAYQTEDAGFYMVDMTNKEGKNVRLWLSNDDKVLERRDQLTREDLPKAVTEAIDRLFNGEKIRNVYRDDLQFYEVDQTDAAGDQISIRVKPNGDVLNVRNVKAQEEENAQTAKHKESAKSNSKKKGD